VLLRFCCECTFFFAAADRPADLRDKIFVVNAWGFSTFVRTDLASYHSTTFPYLSVTTPSELCDNPDQAARWQILGLYTSLELQFFSIWMVAEYSKMGQKSTWSKGRFQVSLVVRETYWKHWTVAGRFLFRGFIMLYDLLLCTRFLWGKCSFLVISCSFQHIICKLQCGQSCSVRNDIIK
jgi:hypothetical protein